MNTLKFSEKSIAPSKIICIGRNYAAHAHELGNEVPDEMVVFLKPNSAIGTQLSAQFLGESVHFEAEICLLIEHSRVVAVAVGLDLTRRDKQTILKGKGLPWERCKAFNGSALFSEFVAFNGNYHDLSLELDINGEAIQRGCVTQMLFPPEAILADLNTFMDLEDHDIIMTGTPAGVGAVPPGGQFVARIFQADKCLIEQTWIAQ